MTKPPPTPARPRRVLLPDELAVVVSRVMVLSITPAGTPTFDVRLAEIERLVADIRRFHHAHTPVTNTEARAP